MGKKRFRVNLVGIVISSLYLCLTITNHYRIKTIFLDNLREREVEFKRTHIAPTILNNALWYCAAETDSVYLQGLYSFFDGTTKMQLYPIPMNRHLLQAIESDPVIERLTWFTNGFYAVLRREDGMLQLNDMRYGTFRGRAETESDYIFRFILEENPDGSVTVHETDPGPPEGESSALMRDLWSRIFGIKEPHDPLPTGHGEDDPG